MITETNTTIENVEPPKRKDNMKLKDYIYKPMEDQFIVNDIYKEGVNPIAITECTPTKTQNNKTICIDFGTINGKNEGRFIPVDVLLMALKDFYGDEYLLNAIKEIKFYNEIKNK